MCSQPPDQPIALALPKSALLYRSSRFAGKPDVVGIPRLSAAIKRISPQGVNCCSAAKRLTPLPITWSAPWCSSSICNQLCRDPTVATSVNKTHGAACSCNYPSVGNKTSKFLTSNICFGSMYDVCLYICPFNFSYTVQLRSRALKFWLTIPHERI